MEELEEKGTIALPVPDILKVIDGTYDGWVPLKNIVDGAEIAERVLSIYCDTRDFALGWNFEKPKSYKKAECGLEVRTNEGLARMKRLENSSAVNNYLIEPKEIVPWLKKLCEKSGGYEEDWRMLVAGVDGCRGWDIKYIRFVKWGNGKFMVCNSYWMPVKWKRILDNLKKPY